MTRKQKIRKEIDFANNGAGTYLCCCLWEMMDDHNLCVWDFHNRTDAWKEAVEASACEAYENTPYEDLWDNILCTSFSEREELDNTAKETARKIKEYLNNLELSHLLGDGLIFNSEGRIEQDA